MEKKIGEKTFKIRGLKYVELLKLPRDDPLKLAREQARLAMVEPKYSDELFNDLSGAEGLELQHAINEASGITEDFLVKLGISQTQMSGR
jgi:hypothetical protein